MFLQGVNSHIPMNIQIRWLGVDARAREREGEREREIERWR